MSKEDYPLEEFVINLANVEERYANEIMSMVECFYKSRIDLPAQRLEEIGKCHLRTSRYLKKVVDPKKSELINLWKICNTFSVASIEVDNAMREVRNSIRKNLKKECGYTKPEMNKRYKSDTQTRKQYITVTGPTESYDFYKPKSWKMKFPFDFRDRKAKRVISVANVPTTPTFQTLPIAKPDSVLRPSSLYSTCSSSSEEPKYQADPENFHKVTMGSKPDYPEQPVAPVRMSKLKQQEPTQMTWVCSTSSDTSNQSNYKQYVPNFNSESYYSNDKNIINVPIVAPRLQTLINIGDTEDTGTTVRLAQTHSIPIYQDTNSST
ncbi:unnamed protein product [Auanema sp. JU1783]|nr:unnamed protein product [Auanema sp. JU1783]